VSSENRPGWHLLDGCAAGLIEAVVAENGAPTPAPACDPYPML
jgi:hypothetical protein